jgi:hypothetical protein
MKVPHFLIGTNGLAIVYAEASLVADLYILWYSVFYSMHAVPICWFATIFIDVLMSAVQSN